MMRCTDEDQISEFLKKSIYKHFLSNSSDQKMLLPLANSLKVSNSLLVRLQALYVNHYPHLKMDINLKDYQKEQTYDHIIHLDNNYINSPPNWMIEEEDESTETSQKYKNQLNNNQIFNRRATDLFNPFDQTHHHECDPSQQSSHLSHKVSSFSFESEKQFQQPQYSVSSSENVNHARSDHRNFRLLDKQQKGDIQNHIRLESKQLAIDPNGASSKLRVGFVQVSTQKDLSSFQSEDVSPTIQDDTQEVGAQNSFFQKIINIFSFKHPSSSSQTTLKQLQKINETSLSLNRLSHPITPNDLVPKINIRNTFQDALTRNTFQDDLTRNTLQDALTQAPTPQQTMKQSNENRGKQLSQQQLRPTSHALIESINPPFTFSRKFSEQNNSRRLPLTKHVNSKAGDTEISPQNLSDMRPNDEDLASQDDEDDLTNQTPISQKLKSLSNNTQSKRNDKYDSKDSNQQEEQQEGYLPNTNDLMSLKKHIKVFPIIGKEHSHFQNEIKGILLTPLSKVDPKQELQYRAQNKSPKRKQLEQQDIISKHQKGEDLIPFSKLKRTNDILEYGNSTNTRDTKYQNNAMFDQPNIQKNQTQSNDGKNSKRQYYFGGGQLNQIHPKNTQKKNETFNVDSRSNKNESPTNITSDLGSNFMRDNSHLQQLSTSSKVSDTLYRYIQPHKPQAHSLNRNQQSYQFIPHANHIPIINNFPHSNSIPNTNSFPHTNANSFPQTNTNSFPHTNTNSFPHTNTNSFPHTNTNNFPHTNTNNFPQTNTNNFLQTNTSNFPRTNANSFPQTNTNNKLNSYFDRKQQQQQQLKQNESHQGTFFSFKK